jgi:outer membrane protein OmpA-like peptidoglycan-associated protein
MQSKILVLIAFAAWSAICWRWYVCGIKDICGPLRSATEAAPNADNGIEPDGSALRPAAENSPESPAGQPSTTPGATTKPAAPPAGTKAPAPISEERINEVQLEQVEDRMVVHFPYNSLRKEDNAAIDDYLDRLAAELKSSGGTVTITGHTDFVGESKDNVQFGLRRAASIRDVLVRKGVAKKQVKIKSFGEAKPVATNDTPLGRYKNRRVEIRVKN